MVLRGLLTVGPVRDNATRQAQPTTGGNIGVLPRDTVWWKEQGTRERQRARSMVTT